MEFQWVNIREFVGWKHIEHGIAVLLLIILFLMSKAVVYVNGLLSYIILRVVVHWGNRARLVVLELAVHLLHFAEVRQALNLHVIRLIVWYFFGGLLLGGRFDVLFLLINFLLLYCRLIFALDYSLLISDLDWESPSNLVSDDVLWIVGDQLDQVLRHHWPGHLQVFPLSSIVVLYLIERFVIIRSQNLNIWLVLARSLNFMIDFQIDWS